MRAIIDHPYLRQTTMATQTILDSIVSAFEHLSNDVKIALRTQLGDSAQLEERIQACSRLLVQINQVSMMCILS